MRETGMLAPARSGWGSWLPWIFVLGVAAYLAAPVEPGASFWGLSALAVAALAGIAVRTGRIGALAFAAAAACGLAGAGWGAWSAHRAVAPVLDAPVVRAAVVGRVESVELRNRGVRIVLADARVSGRDREVVLKRARIFLSARFGEPRPGRTVALTANLAPPPEPAYPGAYSLPRHAWFAGIGAVGYAMTPWREVAAPPPGGMAGIAAHLEGWRRDVRERILAILGRDDPRAGIAVALIVGEKGAIPSAVAEDYRGSGLAHMLAISGLHMSLLAGLAFLAVRRGLALVPAIALRWPIKKIAAAAALLPTFAYLEASGAAIPTQRAFIMTAVALAAVMIERSPFSLRLAAIAAAIVALIDPEAVLGPSFQMSFAAVVALIAAYEANALSRLAVLKQSGGWLLWLPVAILASVATTTVASLATAPVGFYHFGRMATYSIVSNALTLPVLGFWVMPWGVLAALALPFGGAAFPLARMADGIGWINAVAHAVSSWPGHLLHAPAMPGAGIAMCIAGGLWLALAGGRLRAAGLAAIVIGMTSPWWEPPPDLLIGNGGRAIAVRDGDAYDFLGGRREAYARAVWSERTNRAMRSRDADGWRCDPLGCRWQGGDVAVARIERPDGMAEDCAASAVVVTMPSATPGATAVPTCDARLWLDAAAVGRAGTVAVWFDGRGGIGETRLAASAGRPWSRGGSDDDEIDAAISSAE